MRLNGKLLSTLCEKMHDAAVVMDIYYTHSCAYQNYCTRLHFHSPSAHENTIPPSWCSEASWHHLGWGVYVCWGVVSKHSDMETTELMLWAKLINPPQISLITVNEDGVDMYSHV